MTILGYALIGYMVWCFMFIAFAYGYEQGASNEKRNKYY